MEILDEDASEVEPLVTRLRKMSPKVTGGLLRIRQAAYADGLFPAKVKALTALTLSVAIRCEPCIEQYAEAALDEGATFEEVVEFLNVAMSMQGCPGEAWTLKALEIYERLGQGRSKQPAAAGSDACCPE